MVSLLLHGHKNISVTDIACSWSKKCAKENEEVMTIDDLYSNNFKAITEVPIILILKLYALINYQQLIKQLDLRGY